MKRIILLIALPLISLNQFAQIIADHTVVDKYDDIPQQYIDEVKKMWLSYAGESHSRAIPMGLELLEAINPKYSVNVTTEGTPESPTTSHLRASNGRWGKYYGGLGWVYLTGEEDWFTNSSASSGIPEIKDGIAYAYNNGVPVSAMGFGWCFDAVYGSGTSSVDPVYGCRWYGRSVLGPEGNLPWGLDADDRAVTGNSVSLDTYLAATQSYIDYCETNNIPTKIFFTTTTVDHYDGEAGYQGYLKDERIRNYVKADPNRILFDWADILCYNDGSSTPTTRTWNGHTYPYITDSNAQPETADYHFTKAGAIRLAKAMWWMLARMAGWDGGTNTDIKKLTVSPSYEVKLSEGEIIVKFENSSEVSHLQLLSFNGSLAATKQADSDICRFDVSRLPSGLYCLVIINSFGNVAKKVIIP